MMLLSQIRGKARTLMIARRSLRTYATRRRKYLRIVARNGRISITDVRWMLAWLGMVVAHIVRYGGQKWAENLQSIKPNHLCHNSRSSYCSVGVPRGLIVQRF